MAPPVIKRIPIHVRTFLFLAPFFAMLVAHELLGLDDNLLAAPSPGTRDGAAFNLVMVLALWAGSLGYLVHALKHGSASSVWLLVKIAALAALHGAIIWVGTSRG